MCANLSPNVVMSRSDNPNLAGGFNPRKRIREIRMPRSGI